MKQRGNINIFFVYVFLRGASSLVKGHKNRGLWDRSLGLCPNSATLGTQWPWTRCFSIYYHFLISKVGYSVFSSFFPSGLVLCSKESYITGILVLSQCTITAVMVICWWCSLTGSVEKSKINHKQKDFAGLSIRAKRWKQSKCPNVQMSRGVGKKWGENRDENRNERIIFWILETDKQEEDVTQILH
jgi:hypothetical protein